MDPERVGRRALARGASEVAATTYCGASRLAEALALASPGTARGRALIVLARVEHALGRPDEAWACGMAALAHLPESARAMNTLGILAQDRGRFDEARDWLQRALARARSTGDRATEARVLGTLGTLAIRQGALADAQRHLVAALELEQVRGDPHNEAVCCVNLGALHHLGGAFDEARRWSARGAALHEQVGSRHALAVALGNLGAACSELGLLDEALVCLEQAATIHREVGAWRSVALTSMNLGNLRARQGRHGDAVALWADGERRLTAQGEARLLAMMLASRARHEAPHDRRSARERLARAEALAEGLESGSGADVAVEIEKARAALS